MKMKSVTDSWMFRRRDLLGILCLGPLSLLVLFSRPWAPEGSLLDVATDAIGWGCLVLYVVMRVWATLFAGGKKDRVLQTEGPYSITRNPLYLGSLFLALACCGFFQSFTLLIGVAAVYALYARGVVVAEERMLLQLFPEEYAAYQLRTPRFFPRFGAFKSPGKVQVDLGALQREAKRLAGAALLPIAAELVEYARDAPWWPHYFSLP
jgi:protein-S-isoprenylcysteine O-methyltransferase Ste14